jgi:hypothetical protein
MTNKSIDFRRERRTRLKRAMKPIQEAFGCTQMEAAGRVTKMLADSGRVERENQALKMGIEELKTQNEAFKNLITRKSAECAAQQVQICQDAEKILKLEQTILGLEEKQLEGT